MATIQEEILAAFFTKLSQAPEFDSDRIDRLREVFSADTKPKAIDVTAVFVSDPNEDAA